MYKLQQQETSAYSQNAIDSLDRWSEYLKSLKQHTSKFNLLQAVKYLNKQIQELEYTIKNSKGPKYFRNFILLT